MGAILSQLILAAVVNISLTANERIFPPEVIATVDGELVPITMVSPSGDQVHWEGSCPGWPMLVQATLRDLADNTGTCSWEPPIPEVGDVPDVRLGTAPPSPPASGLSSALPPPEGAFDLFDFVETNDFPYSELLVPENMEVHPSQGPPWFGEAADPNPVVSMTREAVDKAIANVSTSSAEPGWAAVDYALLDGRLSQPEVLLNPRGYVKYSTFSLNGPGLLSARMFDIMEGRPPLVQTWIGNDLRIDSLASLISPPTPVGWTIYVNDLDYCVCNKGDVLGINPIHQGHGSIISHHGWAVGIDHDGMLRISGEGALGEGPYLIGVLARNTSHPQDTDTARFLLTKGLLAECYPYPPATHDRSETLDGLTLGAIPLPNTPSPDIRVPIQEGSHWGYHFFADDTLSTPAPLEVVDLWTDPHLPKAADPAYMAGLMLSSAVTSVATGRALKATLVPTGTLPTPGIRLVSRAFTGLRPGDVLTFAVNIATDIQDATHSPLIGMDMSSGWGAAAMGFRLSSLALPEIPITHGTPLGEYQHTLVPWANEGWQTFSTNYTPPVSEAYIDTDQDGDFDDEDRHFLANHPTVGSLTTQGWEGGITVARAGMTIKTRTEMTKPFHVWLDNFRVYRSAYELDLGLSKTEYTEPASLVEGPLPPGIVVQPEAPIDGSFDDFTSTGDIGTDMSRIGWVIENGSAPSPPHLVQPFGWYPPTTRYVNAHESTFSVRQGLDRSGMSSNAKCLQIGLVGPDGRSVYEGDFVSVRARIHSPIVAVSGSGIYCIETYVSKAWPTNLISTQRTPAVMIELNEVAPNPFAHSSGAYFNYAGLPNSVSDPHTPWLRVVATAYIPDAQLVRGILSVWEPFVNSAVNFAVPVLFDDFHIYRVDDPAHFFDADMFDVQ